MDTCHPNAYLVGNKIQVQLTTQYHVPFELSIQDAETLVEELTTQLSRHSVKLDKNPWCICGTKKSYHDMGVGACGEGIVCETDFGMYDVTCTCKKFRLDPQSHKRYQLAVAREENRTC